MNILIVKRNNELIFSKSNSKLKSNDLDLKLDKFIISTNNYDEIFIKFLKKYLKHYKVTNILVEDSEISEYIIGIINIAKIKLNVSFIYEEELSYSLSSIILQCKYINKINCYSMPESIYYSFPKGKIETKKKISLENKFIKRHSINSYSDLYNKETAVVDLNYLKSSNDFFTLLKNNKKLNRIVFENYSNYNNLEKIISVVNRNITIYLICNDDTFKLINRDLKKIKLLAKKYKIKIKTMYNENYIEKNKKKQIRMDYFIKFLICIIFIIIILVCTHKYSNKNTKEKVTNVKEKITLVKEKTDKPKVENVEKVENNESYMIFNDMFSQNSDTVGWLKVNNTKIDYPVVQYSDNDYYLNHSFDKSFNYNGWVFADYRNNLDELDQNTIIYGHSSVLDGLMFSELENTLDESWYLNEDNIIINFDIKGKKNSWKIFSIYTISVTTDYLYINFDSESDYINFISMIKSRSIYDFNTDVGANSKILTLSTCYKTDKNRVVVHAVLLDE